MLSRGSTPSNRVFCVLVPALAAGVVLGACGSADPSTTPARAATSDGQPVIVTRDDEEHRRGCSPATVGRRLRGYSDALESVDTEALREYWGRKFAWLNVLVEPGGFEAKDRGEGLRELSEVGGIRLRFTELETSGEGDTRLNAVYDGYGTEDRPRAIDLTGKVQLACGDKTVRQMSAFPSKGPKPQADCPKPERPVDAEAIIVCASRDD